MYELYLYFIQATQSAKIGPSLVCQVPKPGDFTWRDDNPTNKNPAKQLENSWNNLSFTSRLKLILARFRKKVMFFK